MSQKRRKEILSLSERYQVPLVEDDPYGELYFSASKPTPIKAYDHSHAVLYTGTFSKTLCPGLRVGWIVAEKSLIEKLTSLKQSTDLHTSTLTQLELCHVLTHMNWQKHLQSIRTLYKAKKEAMLVSLEEHMPQTVQYTRPEGGLFIWVTLPEGLDAETVADRAIEHRVTYVPGRPFYALQDNRNHLRLCYAGSSLDEIRTGIKRLADALSDLDKEAMQ